MIEETIPTDVLKHFQQMLPNNSSWETRGSGGRRIWKFGGAEVDSDDQVLTGKVGWHPAEEEEVADYSDADEDWITSIEAPHGRVVLPYGFDAETRILAVLRRGRSRAVTIGGVFEGVLDQHERALSSPTTEWSVEAILDGRDFAEWLQSMDVVKEVEFVAKLPNPTPTPAMEDVYKRLTNRNATRLIENFRSTRPGGLKHMEDDPDFLQAEAMAREGFATLKGRGESDGSRRLYNQNDRVRRANIDHLPETWGQMREVIRDFLKERARGILSG